MSMPIQWSALPSCVQAGFVDGYFDNKYTTNNCTRTRKTLATGAYLNGNEVANNVL